MNYKLYQKSRDLAWEILYREGICSLPVDLLAICRSMKIRIVEYDEPRPDLGEGFSCMIDGVPHICVQKGIYPPRRRFTIAHELGHILLGHVGVVGLVNREPAPGDDPMEQAANAFAARLLAPACVLWGCKVSSAAEIAALCGISDAAARYRWERLQTLFERGKFLSSPLERKVYRRFAKHIKTHQPRDL